MHGAVVLVPLAALALAATGWRAEWRTRYGLAVTLLGLAGSVFAFLAKQTGEPLEHDVRSVARAQLVEARFGEHPEQGDTAMLFAVLFGLVLLGYLILDRFADQWRLPRWTGLASYGVALVVATLALVTMLIAGHSGATLVWKDLGTFAAAKQ